MQMTAEELLPAVKKWMRIGSDAVNEELTQTIYAAQLDLKNGGVVNTNLADPLIQQAVKLYCKAQFGYDADSEKFSAAYERLKSALSLSGFYNKADS